MSQLPNASGLDAAVWSSRASKPLEKEAVEQRTEPRLSLAELNQHDLMDLQRRALAAYDNRGPVQRVLDVIDLPRNTIAGLLAPELRRKAQEAGETGTFGMGRVSVSDMLGAAGVENRVVRGVLGFAGDVALDPLTYLGPAGWAARATAVGGKVAKGARGADKLADVAGAAKRAERSTESAGRALGTVEFRGGFQGAVKQAGRAVASGNQVKDDVLRNYYDAWKQWKPNADVGEAFTGRKTSGKAASALSWVGGDLDFTGGDLAKLLYTSADDLDDAGKAAKAAAQNVVLKYGKGTEPGITIGKGGVKIRGGGRTAEEADTLAETMGVAHIPFTDISLNVPAWTVASRNARMNLRLAGRSALADTGLDDIFRKAVPVVAPASVVPDVANVAEPAKNTITDIAKTRLKPFAERAVGPDELASAFDEITDSTREVAATSRVAISKAQEEVAKIQAKIDEELKIAGKGITQQRQSQRVLQNDLSKDYPVAAGESPRGPMPDMDPVVIAERMPTEARPEVAMRSLAYTESWLTADKMAAGSTNDLLVGDKFDIGEQTVTVAARNDDGSVVLSIEGSKPVAASDASGAKELSRSAETTTTTVTLPNDSKFYSSEGSFFRPLLADNAGVEKQLAEATRELRVARRVQQLELKRHAERAAQIRQQIEAGLQNAANISDKLTPDQLLAIRTRMEELTAMQMAVSANLKAAQKATWSASRIDDPTLIPKEQAAELAKAIDDDVGLGVALQKIYADASAAAIALGNIYRAPVMSLIGSDLSGPVELAKSILATNDVMLGLGALAGVSKAVTAALHMDYPGQMEFIRNLESLERTFFGNRNGLTAAPFKTLQFLARGGDKKAEAFAEKTLASLFKAMDEAGIDQGRYQEVSAMLLALIYARLDEAGRGSIYWTKPGFRDIPLAELKALKAKNIDEFRATANNIAKLFIESEESGILTNPALRQTLTQIADESIRSMDEMKNLEQADNILTFGLDNYAVPVSDTPEARAAAQRMQSTEVPGDIPNRKAGEAFTKTRGTQQFRYLDKEGNVKTFLQMHTDLIGLSDDAINQLAMESGSVNVSRANKLKEYRDIAAEYFDRAAAGEQMPVPKATDAMSLNLSGEEGFRDLVEVAFGSTNVPIFDIDPVSMLVRRIHQHETATATRSALVMLNQYAYYGVDFDALRAVINKPNASVKLKDGRLVKPLVFRTQTGESAVGFMVGDVAYRELAPMVRSSRSDLFKSMFGATLSGAAMPNVLADRIEGIEAALREQEGPIMRGIESFTSAWKTITLLHPSYIVNNTIGNNLLLAGGDPAGGRYNLARINTEYMPKVIRMFRDKRLGRPIEATFEAGGQQVSIQSAFDDAVRLRVIDSSFTSQNTAPSIHEAVKYSGPADQVASDIARRRGALVPTIGDKFQAVLGKASDKVRRTVIKPFFDLATATDNAYKFAAYMDRLAQGDTPEQAASAVLRTLFDYSDLTNLETKFRTLMPFYSWIRNNTGYQLKNFLRRPAYAAAFPKVKEALEEFTAGEEKLPEYARPRWMRESLAIQFGSDPETRAAFLAGSRLPVEQLYRLLAITQGQQGLLDTANYLGSMVNPFAGAAAALAFGREMFSGREIGPDADKSVPEYLGSLFRPINETGKFVGAVSEGEPVRAVSRLFLGGGVQDMSDERVRAQVLRDYTDRVERLRRKIRRAERGGNKKASQDARADLLQVYRAMIQGGLQDEVPKWAIEQIGILEQGT